MTRVSDGGSGDDDARRLRHALEAVEAALRAAGFYAYITLDSENRWSVACDTDEGHVDVRLGADGYDLDVWDTSPGMFLDDEDERRRAARERLARVSLPALARGYLEPNQEVWWDETDRGVGARLRFQLPFALGDRIGDVAKQRLAELNALIALVETKLVE